MAYEGTLIGTSQIQDGLDRSTFFSYIVVCRLRIWLFRKISGVLLLSTRYTVLPMFRSSVCGMSWLIWNKNYTTRSRSLKGELSSFPNLCAEILNSMLKWLFQYEFLRNVIVDAFKHTNITFFDQNAWKRVCVIRNILQIDPKCQLKGNNFRKLTGNVD